MKVKLPSNGLFGSKTIDLREPTFEDIRKSWSLNQEEPLFKIQFVQQLANIDLSKVTKQDIEYLFTIAAFSIQFNTVLFSTKCTCGNVINNTFSLPECDVVDIKPYKLPYKTKVDGVDCSFTVLSAQQDLDACEYALSEEDFNSSYEDALATLGLCKSLSDVELVRNLPSSVYLASFLFQQANFHGVDLVKEVVCPHCGATLRCKVSVDSSYVKMKIETLMDIYASLSKIISFETFAKFTVPEYTAYIKALNKK